jgi:hypothetical protein
MKEPTQLYNFQLFYKYKYIQQCTMNFLKKINLKENQRGILTSI